jgi:HNH endonuclease
MSFERDEVAAAYAERDYILSSYVEKPGTLETPCWIWQRACNGQGYGNLRFRGFRYSVYRLIWILANGPIPDDLWCLHRCDRPACLNPDHLFLADAEANARDRDQKGRANVCDRYSKSQYVGVSLNRKRWQARAARANGKQVHLGTFSTELEAASARNGWDLSHGRPPSNSIPCVFLPCGLKESWRAFA